MPGTSRRTAIVAAAVLTACVIATAGCSSSSPGAAVFQRERCPECHTIKGIGGSTGPNLTVVGKRRSRDYIVAQIMSPASHNPNTAMPSFKHLPEKDIQALADYLSGLK